MVETVSGWVKCKILRIVKDMYHEIKFCVKHLNSYSDFFSYSVGLRQGEVISPVLVSLFLEDLELFLQDKVSTGNLIDDIVLILLLFADDMVLFGNSPENLPKNLNLLHNYCKQWGLEVNDSKTKIMAFRKRGNQKLLVSNFPQSWR